MNQEIERRARRLADEIKARTRGLDHEDVQAVTPGWMSHARAKKHRDQDRARVNGMTIALTYMLDAPLDMELARQFIEDTPTWRGLLPNS